MAPINAKGRTHETILGVRDYLTGVLAPKLADG